MTDTTQPLPEPSEVSAMSLPRYTIDCSSNEYGTHWHVESDSEGSLCLYADAKSQIDALSAEVERITEKRTALHNALHSERDRTGVYVEQLLTEREALRSEVARLTGERDALQSSLRHANAMREENADSIAILRAQVDALAVDAGRYRWLRADENIEHPAWCIVNDANNTAEQMDAAIDTAIAQTKPTCRKCGAPMAPGIALQQTWTGSGDFGRDDVVTLSPGGQGKIVPCEKCTACGWSVTSNGEA